jgi:hypothetical protein
MGRSGFKTSPQDTRPNSVGGPWRSILKILHVFLRLNATVRLGLEPRFFIEGFETTSSHAALKQQKGGEIKTLNCVAKQSSSRCRIEAGNFNNDQKPNKE